MNRIIRYAGVLLLALIAACSGDEEHTSNNGKTVFRYNEMGGLNSLDPAAANKVENIWAVNQLFSGLLQLDDSLKVIPSVANSWEVSEDGLEYTFHLRNDVYFHDNLCFEGGKGRKVIAADFEYSFFRLMELKSERSSAYIFKLLDRTSKTQKKGFLATNDSTFKIYLKAPFPAFLEILTMHYFSVVPHEATDYYGDDFGRNPVGTGPFKFKLWDEGQRLVFVKNPNYHEYYNGSRLPYLDAVSISFVKDREIAMADFVSGKFEMLSGLESINKSMILEKNGTLMEKYKGKFVIQKSPYLKTDYLGILLDPELEIASGSPLINKNVRKAVAHAIDKEKIVRYLRNNVGIAATSGFIPKGLSSFDANTVIGPEYNPVKAKQLLEKEGYGPGKKDAEITLHITHQFNEISQFIKKQLEDVGFKVSINVNANAIQSEVIARGSVNFFRKSWVGDYADAQNFFSVFYSKNFSPEGSNYFHFSNIAFDNLYEKAFTVQNDTARFALYRDMDRILMDELPVIPLFYDEVFRLVQLNVEGLTTNPMNLLNLKKVKVKS